jgi:hypothetical protein
MMKYISVSVVSVVLYAIVPVAASAFTERFGVQPDTSYYKDTVRDREGDRSVNEKSDDSTLSKGPQESGGVGRFPDSLNGHPGGLGFGGGISSADPSVQDLSRMDGGGFAPPGSYTGSMRRP